MKVLGYVVILPDAETWRYGLFPALHFTRDNAVHQAARISRLSGADVRVCVVVTAEDHARYERYKGLLERVLDQVEPGNHMDLYSEIETVLEGEPE